MAPLSQERKPPANPGRFICIGVEGFHSPFKSEADILQLCRRHDFDAKVNSPFAGSIVPSNFWGKDDRVRSFMIEARRDLYMNEQTGVKRADFTNQAERVTALIEVLVARKVEELHFDAKSG